ncbi:uncharacterized protein LOC131172963 [Hevea brasiliensis]|uniref:uncharacterized protein LOC131172963 n=1 Tax=Hevea brasiliensis TaxID=3981 RepID=UPI0025CCE063|nr:uncharacterized protein LOC131172963 [Hevea brasiliensis]
MGFNHSVDRQQYSSWPIIVTPYNLPPWLCMKEEYMFLTVIVPGPRNPKDKLDVYLQPLIAELKQLWEVGVETYDASKKNNFNMRVALLWTISDFPAYSMLSGWSTAGKTACPYCRDDSDAFTLTKGGKQSWFDNHHMGADENNNYKAKNTGWKRRSIFWDLPYWSTNMLRHNLDVMHIEKNVFENIFNTVMNVEGKTKDNAKSREDLKEFCHRPELERDMATGKYPKACYTLDKQSKAVLCEWLKNLIFPDCYVSNMHLGIASKNVWQALTELSNFFRELTSTTLREEAMLQLNEEIPIILCKLERIFPPSFFDSMEHLPVHLAYEAWILVLQYRWMYPFERYLRKLKNNVKNKAKVEGSICNAYLVEEASSFCAIILNPMSTQGIESIFVNELHMANPNINDKQVDEKLEREFDKWFNKYGNDEQWGMYQGTNYKTNESDYYGQLIEVLRLEYLDYQSKESVLFKCDWFDPIINVGTKIHPKYKLMDINHKRSLNRYEPFVLAIQATQVNYSIYPSLKCDKDDWWAVFKIKVSSVIDLPEQVNVTTPPAREEPFQEDEMEVPLIQIDDDDDQQQYLNDQNGVLVEINEEDVEDEEELELDSESDEECDDVYDSDTN